MNAAPTLPLIREADLRLLVLAGLQLEAYGTEDGLTPAERIAAVNDALLEDVPCADPETTKPRRLSPGFREDLTPCPLWRDAVSARKQRV